MIERLLSTHSTLKLFALVVLVGLLAACGSLGGDIDVEGKGRGNGATVQVPDGEFGETVVATITGDTSDMYLYTHCSQDGEMVMHWRMYLDGENSAPIMLGPTMVWTSGDAECTAELGYFHRGSTWRVQASDTFSVVDAN